jgi:hypothetical protein
MRGLFFVILVGVFLFSSIPARSQSFIIGPGATEEVLMMFSALAAGGSFHTADVHGLMGFDVGLRGVFVFVPDKYQFLPEPEEGPFKGVGAVGVPILQGSVGLPFGLEALGRLFHYSLGDEPTDAGVTLVGVGLKYGLLQQPLLPKVAVLAAYHGFFVPEEYNFGTVSVMSAKLVASKDVLIATLYAGLGVDRTSLRLRENLPLAANTERSYDVNNIHGNIGLVIRPFPLLFVNADYNYGKFSGFNIGAGISFR